MNRRHRKRGFKYYVLKGKLEIDPVTGCWIWLGHTVAGYGVITARLAGDTKPVHRTAQRHFYILYKGDPGPKFDVAHRCHRRSCCNPRHTEPKTRRANCADWFLDQRFTPLQCDEVARYLALDMPFSWIADRMCAPRPYIARLARRLNYEKYQVLFDFTMENTA